MCEINWSAFEAVGTWVAPIGIFWAAFILSDRRETKSAKMKVLLEVSTHCQLLFLVCSQARIADKRKAVLGARIAGLRPPAVGSSPESDQAERRDLQVHDRQLVERLAELSASLSGDCSMVEMTFEKSGAALTSAIVEFIRSIEKNVEAEVASAFAQVAKQVRALGRGILGKSAGPSEPQGTVNP
jgi:hypothetical protein